MSRHSFVTGQQRWTVGWAPAKASYYAQVEPAVTPAPVPWWAPATSVACWDPAEPGYDDPLTTVVGVQTGEVPTVSGLARALTGQVQLPADVHERLANERRAGGTPH